MIRTPGKVAIKVMDMGGCILANYQSEGELTVAMNYSNGMYLVGVTADQMPRVATYKVMLCK